MTLSQPGQMGNKLDRILDEIDSIQAKFFKNDSHARQLQSKYLAKSPHAGMYNYMKQYTVAIAEKATRKVMKDHDISTRRKFMFDLGIMMGYLNDTLLFNDTRILKEEEDIFMHYRTNYYLEALCFLKSYLLMSEETIHSIEFYKEAVGILERKLEVIH